MRDILDRDWLGDRGAFLKIVRTVRSFFVFRLIRNTFAKAGPGSSIFNRIRRESKVIWRGQRRAMQEEAKAQADRSVGIRASGPSINSG